MSALGRHLLMLAQARGIDPARMWDMTLLEFMNELRRKAGN